MFVVLLVFLFALNAIWPILWIRNNKVYAYRIKVIHWVGEAAQADIDACREWEWRYMEFEIGPSYNQMVLRFWKPLRSFYADKTFMEAP